MKKTNLYKNNKTPLCIALENDRFRIADYLISKGSEIVCLYYYHCNSHVPAPFYQCYDCFTDSGHSICPICAYVCHSKHNIRKFGQDDPKMMKKWGDSFGSYYCDCGEGNCQICFNNSDDSSDA